MMNHILVTSTMTMWWNLCLLVVFDFHFMHPIECFQVQPLWPSHRHSIRSDGSSSLRLHSIPTVGRSTKPSTVLTQEDLPSRAAQLSFSHVHLYTDEIQDVHIYKELERNVNALGQAISNHNNDNDDHNDDSMTRYQVLWKEIIQDDNTATTTTTTTTTSAATHVFVPQNRDIIKQLIVGLGFRITATSTNHNHHHGKHVLLTTQDPHGVQFVISAKDTTATTATTTTATPYAHLSSNNIQEFYNHNSNRQGFAVMGFEVTHGDIQDIYNRYLMLHPTLIVEEYVHGPWIYNSTSSTSSNVTITTKILEVYAYYKNEKGGPADTKTRLRFLQHDSQSRTRDTSTIEPLPILLPGLQPIHATFDSTCMSAYCDHWVSNVISRTGFIETLEETLGFTTKVDFNAGVVAAGEAQIESTVTGNDSFFETDDYVQALKDQSQVYLPINNALSNVGHVHGFLQELGQGIQHIASRVEDLPKFVQRGNDFRTITGEGFTFLNIPRSYYGVLSIKMLVHDAGISEECAKVVFRILEERSFMSEGGAISLDATEMDLLTHLQESMLEYKELMQDFECKKQDIVHTILQSRFINMYNLLGDNLSTETYLSIVRNQILVDVQGNDLLFQIFTSNVLQKNPNDESPFLEFIQRVCSVCNDGNRSKMMKAGCGGFGIRNFLTLFLSIEVGKAMLDVAKAKEEDDVLALAFAQQRVDAFTDQLNESNPILTEISDAMTAEGIALEKMQKALMDGNNKLAEEYKIALELAEATKMKSNEKLMACSSKYNQRMKELRLAAAQAIQK